MIRTIFTTTIKVWEKIKMINNKIVFSNSEYQWIQIN